MNTPKIRNGLVLVIRLEKSIWFKWVKPVLKGVRVVAMNRLNHIQSVLFFNFAGFLYFQKNSCSDFIRVNSTHVQSHFTPISRIKSIYSHFMYKVNLFTFHVQSHFTNISCTKSIYSHFMYKVTLLTFHV